MKTSFLVLSFFMAFSCAKKNPEHKGNPIKALTQMKESFLAEAKAAKRVPLVTKNLDLIYPNDEKSGKLRLVGKDAKALYLALRISPIDINDSEFYESMNEKNNGELVCLEMVSIDPEEETAYGCELQFHYGSGKIKGEVKGDSLDETIPKLVEDYSGFTLFLDSLKSKRSSITLKENTALILYNLLEVHEEEATGDSVKKVGHSYTCLKTRSEDRDDVITCTITIDHETGKVKTQI